MLGATGSSEEGGDREVVTTGAGRVWVGTLNEYLCERHVRHLGVPVSPASGTNASGGDQSWGSWYPTGESTKACGVPPGLSR